MAIILGPPQINNAKPPPHQTQTATTTPSLSHPFDSTTLIPNRPQMGLTENFSPTFLATGNPCLDFFFHVVPRTPPDTVFQRLQLAWAHQPLTALKLVFNLRALRGTGKSDRDCFFAAATWIHNHHPKTLAANVPALADFACFKDLPEILYRLLQGSQVRNTQKQQWQQIKPYIADKKNKKEQAAEPIGENPPSNRARRRALKESRKQSKLLKKNFYEAVQKDGGCASREEKKLAMARKLLDRYNSDADFRSLHDRISDHFAECLKQDLESLNSGSLSKISLAAKWCPSVDSSFDRSTLLCESIARRLFPRGDGTYPEYEGIGEAHYAYRVRDRLRKEVLVPLRKALELPEVYIGANHWDMIPYNRVASVAMKSYKEKFLKHDKERFEKYLEDVESGKATIAAGALLPHEIIGCLEDGDGGKVAELQWSRMVSDMLQKGKLQNCLAVCDVSGSMNGVPMEVSVALGLLVSELSEEPWKGKVITFSANPQLHLIQGDDLKSKTEFIRKMEWGANTDFQEVFDRILEVAVNGSLREDQMIKKVFVFSDMEFDQASASSWRGYRYADYDTESDEASANSKETDSDTEYEAFKENSWETDYQAIRRKYREKGYGNAVPQIVFWNLRCSRATPVPSKQKGVALVSGFSKNLLTLFMDSDGEINPEAAMEAAISGPEYQKLVVLD